MAKPPLVLQTTTLWDYPSQHYGDTVQGDPDYAGATPSFVIWNLLSRYTHKGEIVVDPMAGSGTTLDVAKDLERKALGFDIAPFRKDIARADARKIPLKNASADFVFVDPPYSTHIAYSDDPACIGRLDAASKDYFWAMEQVIREIDRILKPGRYMALYVSDSFKKGAPFVPIGIELFALLKKRFVPVDIICVVRRNAKLKRNHWHTAAIEGNYFLRGFNYLFIMRKRLEKKGLAPKDRRDKAELRQHLLDRTPAKTPARKGARPTSSPKKKTGRKKGL